jgi:hypothetical protein
LLLNFIYLKQFNKKYHIPIEGVTLMLVPKVDNFNKTNEEQGHVVTIESINMKADFYNLEINYEEKKRIKFIKYIEKLVRQSYEYKTYIGFLKNELNLTKCTFLPMIDTNEIKRVGVEFHHYPFTLFDITSIVLDEHMLIKNEKHINPFKIAEEIMELHFQNYIGLVPLTTTVHELVHSGKVFVNLKYVFGNYTKFMNRYESANSDSYKQMFANLVQLSDKEDKDGDINGDILDKNLMTLEIKDVEPIRKIEIEEDMLA